MVNDGENKRKIYLDNAATTPVFPQVRDIMLQVLETDYGNPSSRHTLGINAEQYIKRAAEQIAGTLKCSTKEIIFTSGGTESNNMAIFGTVLAHQRDGKHLITTKIEHPSVLEPFVQLEKMGYEVTYLPVDENGHVLPEDLMNAVRSDTILVSVMMVNNEIGAWEDVKTLVEAARKQNPRLIFHVDAIQAYGKYKIIPKRMGIDLLSVSGHKIHGPKGSGFLYVKEGTKIRSILYGGGQQRGMRSGTENVPAIAGLGEAARCYYQEHAGKREQLFALKKYFIEKVQQIEGTVVHGIHDIHVEDTAPHIVSVSFRGIKSEVLLHALAAKGVYVSSGSACSSNHPALSGTLRAIGVEEELLDSTLRFSFSIFTTKEEIDYALDVVAQELPVLRRFISK